jgi:hypothetical protein
MEFGSRPQADDRRPRPPTPLAVETRKAVENAISIRWPRLTLREQRENILVPARYLARQSTEFAMAESAPLATNDHYEQACDQAIAMCGGNLRGAIKALIMANEYLEAELQELQALVSGGLTRTGAPRAKGAA